MTRRVSSREACISKRWSSAKRSSHKVEPWRSGPHNFAGLTWTLPTQCIVMPSMPRLHPTVSALRMACLGFPRGGPGLALVSWDGTVIAFTGLECKFKNPIRIGDTIRLAAKIKQTKEMKAAGGGFVVLDVRVLNQLDKTVIQGE